MKNTLKLPLLALVFLIFACKENNSVEPDKPDPVEPNEVVFSVVETSLDFPIQSVQFISEQEGYIAGGLVYPDLTAQILKTEDGGATWKSLLNRTGYYITKIAVGPKDYLWALTNKGLLLKSVDKGATWSFINSFEGIFFMKDIAFIDNDNGIIVGSQSNGKGVILRSKDGGASWQMVNESENIPILENNQLSSIEIVGSTVFLSGGTWDNGTVLRSNDNGNTWAEEVLSNEVKITDIKSGNGTVMAVGNNGQTNSATEKGALFKLDENNQWEQIDTGFDNKILRLSIQDDFIGVIGENKSNNLIESSFLMTSFDAGAHWFRMEHPVQVAGWQDITFVNQNTAIMTGNNGIILKMEIIE